MLTLSSDAGACRTPMAGCRLGSNGPCATKPRAAWRVTHPAGEPAVPGEAPAVLSACGHGLWCGHGLCSWVLPCAASVPYITARWRNRCSLGLGERRGTGIARPSLRCAGSAPLPGSASCGLLCADAQLKSAVADLGSVEHCVPCDVPHRAHQVALVPGALAHWHHWHHVDPRWCALSLCVLSF